MVWCGDAVCVGVVLMGLDILGGLFLTVGSGEEDEGWVVQSLL